MLILALGIVLKCPVKPSMDTQNPHPRLFFSKSNTPHCFSAFIIISNMNKSQDEDFWSLSLFSLCSSIAGFLYPVKMKCVESFSTTMTVSGDGYATGKSLLYDVAMRALYGKRLQCSSPNSLQRCFEMLASGTPIYGRYLTTL